MWLSVLSAYTQICLKNYTSESVRSVGAVVLENHSIVFVVNSCFKETLSKNKQIDRNVLSKKTWPFKWQDVHLYWRARIAAKTFNGNVLTEVMGICLGSTNIFEMFCLIGVGKGGLLLNNMFITYLFYNGALWTYTTKTFFARLISTNTVGEMIN